MTHQRLSVPCGGSAKSGSRTSLRSRSIHGIDPRRSSGADEDEAAFEDGRRRAVKQEPKKDEQDK